MTDAPRLQKKFLSTRFGDIAYLETGSAANPPVLFVRGTLVRGEGERAVALVGSRPATPLGLTFAQSEFCFWRLGVKRSDYDGAGFEETFVDAYSGNLDNLCVTVDCAGRHLGRQHNDLRRPAAQGRQ